MKLNRMPDISQFRQVIRAVQLQARYEGLDVDGEPIYNNDRLPVLTAHGTVKIHGTNAGVSYHKGDLYCQSKKSVISIEKDNAGFAFFVEQRKQLFNLLFDVVKERYKIDSDQNIITIMGEFAGKGIQGGVAVSQLDKKFYIFGIKISPLDEEIPSYWVIDHDIFPYLTINFHDIYSTNQFKTFEIDIDFNEPLFSQNEMVDMVAEVEAECPVGKHFGVSGIGEGIVFTFNFKGGHHVFKMKGEKHAGKSKVKTAKKVDDVELQKIIDLVAQVTPVWRLEQMFNETFDTLNGGKGDVKGTGDFLRAVHKDIMKEEFDLIAESGFEPKQLNGRISKEAREWFMKRLDEEAGI